MEQALLGLLPRTPNSFQQTLDAFRTIPVLVRTVTAPIGRLASISCESGSS
jgi:hypothetical protein